MAKKPLATLRRPKMLCLGASYPSIEGQMKRIKMDPQKLAKHCRASLDSVAAAVECVYTDVLTQMDARDLARCIATEKHCEVDVYTVSQENGAVYNSNRHLCANFNRRGFARSLRRHFDNGQFDQVVLDYFWIPTSWNANHWNRSFFEYTLVNLVKEQVLRIPTKPSYKTSSGLVFLPFCFYCFKEVIACQNTLFNHYNISFLRKRDLESVWLWSGTQQIDGTIMQRILGKRIDQEEIYCTFGPRDVSEAIEDADVSKKMIIDLARQLEDFPDIRFIVLEPLPIHDESVRTTRSQTKMKTVTGTFLGLTKPAEVKRGFLQADLQSPSTPQKLASASKVVSPSPKRLRAMVHSRKHKRSPNKDGMETSRKVKRHKKWTRSRSPNSAVVETVATAASNKGGVETPRRVERIEYRTRSRSSKSIEVPGGTVKTVASNRDVVETPQRAKIHKYRTRSRSPKSVVVETVMSVASSGRRPKALFND